MDEYVRSLGVPGVTVSIRSCTYGSWNWYYGEKITTSMQFPIGSVTKTFTGTAFLQAYDQDIVPDLDVPISTVYLGVPNGNTITIREVGEMRSGLFNYSEALADVIYDNPGRQWSVGELLLSGLTFAPYFPPGTSFHYSNTNSAILGSALERLYKKPLGQILQERLIDPIGLKSTYFGDLRGGNAMVGYRYEDGMYVPIDWSNRSWAYAAGEIVSTIDDMHMYTRKSILQHLTLSNDATAQQRRWQTSKPDPFGEEVEYGFHMEKTGTYIGHSGSIPGCSCAVYGNSSTKTTLVVVSNAQVSPDGIEVADSIAEEIISIFDAM